MFRDYFAILPTRSRRVAILLIVLLAGSGIAEAAALTTLIPLINPTSVLSSDNLLSAWLRDRDVDPDELTRVALAAFVVLGLGSAALKFLAESAILRLRVGTERDMRMRLTEAMLRMSWTSFHVMRLGDITKAVVAEGNNASLGLQVLLQGTGNALIAVTFTIAAIILSPELTAFTLAFAAVIAAFYYWVNRHAESRSRQLSTATSHIGEDTEDVFGTLKFVRSTGAVSVARDKAFALYQGFAALSFKAHVLISGMRLIFDVSGVLFVGAVLLSTLLTTDGLTATSLAFLALFYRLAPRLQAVQEQVLLARTYRSWLITWRRRLLLAEQNADPPHGLERPKHELDVRLDNVTVTYPGAAHDALHEVSLTIPRGSCVAVVGESGSGKSTMLDLLTGLIAPTRGQVVLDGVATTADIDIAEWQSHIGLVLQDTPIYHATVAENIAWQLPTADRADIVRSAEIANAGAFINGLAEGFETVVGERGGRLSGGQRQRLALARALCRSPWLLLLDEATSALDAESEALVLSALERVRGSSTIVIVAHRLATTRIADLVVVMSEGRIVQQGTFTELLAEREGPFAALAVRQGLGADTGPEASSRKAGGEETRAGTIR